MLIKKKTRQEKTEEKIKKHLSWKTKFKLILALLIAIALTIGGLMLKAYIQSGTDIRLTDDGYTHNDAFANCIVVNGIDVSTHQGEEINWAKVKTSGADFVFIRGGYRSVDDGSLHEDAQFETNMKGAKKAGLMIGVYFYSQALTPDEAIEEADFLLKLVKRYDIDLPLVIDFELYHGGRLENKIEAGDLYAASLYHDIVLAFCERVESKGYESMVYANADMLTHYMDYTILTDDATLWLANYGKSTDLEPLYQFWQCSQESIVGGIPGKVDQNFWYIEPGKVYPTYAKGKGKEQVSISDCEVTFSEESYKIKMRRAEPEIEVNIDGKKLKEGRDYVFSPIKNTEPGTGYIIIRGIGRYKDWMAVPFDAE